MLLKETKKPKKRIKKIKNNVEKNDKNSLKITKIKQNVSLYLMLFLKENTLSKERVNF